MTSVTREECGIFECNHCHKFFTTDHSLQRHITKRHNQTVTSVKVVAPCYSDETSVFTYADEETLTCDVCGLTCIGEASFYKHMFIHSNLPSENRRIGIEPVTSGTHLSDINSLLVNTTHTVIQHTDVNELVNPKPQFDETSLVNYSKLHKCDICNKTFDNDATLEDHRTRYSCHQCEAVFCSFELCKKHLMKKHVGHHSPHPAKRSLCAKTHDNQIKTKRHKGSSIGSHVNRRDTVVDTVTSNNAKPNELIYACDNTGSEHDLLEHLYSVSSLIHTDIDKQTVQVSKMDKPMVYNKQPQVVYDYKHVKPNNCTYDTSDDLYKNKHYTNNYSYDDRSNHSAGLPKENCNDHPTTELHFTGNASNEPNTSVYQPIFNNHSKDEIGYSNKLEHDFDDLNDDNGIETGRASNDLKVNSTGKDDVYGGQNSDDDIEIVHATGDLIGDTIDHTNCNIYQPNINNHNTAESDHAAEYLNEGGFQHKDNKINQKHKSNHLKPYDNTKISSIDMKILVDDNKISNPKISASQKSDNKGKYSKKTPYKCHVCEKVFTQSSHFKSHAALHTGEAYTKCKICGKYLTAASMSKHINRHKGIIEKNYKCLICGKSFASNYYFKIHKRIHTGEKPFGCSVCKQRFIRKDSLKLHVCMSRRKEKESKKDTTNLSKDTSYCDICGTTFNSSKSYKAHYRTTHLDEEQTDDYNDRKPFKCDLCDNKFISKGNLKYHLYSHLGREAFPYQCDVCFKKFSHQSNLRGHMRTHTNVRPFKCEVCEVSFKRGTHLRNHMRIHTGDFDTCPKCAKTFSHARYLKDHLKQVHSLILNKDSQLVKFTETTRLKKGFKCEICGKELTRKTRLNDHMRLHTGHKAFKCGNCDEGFISTYYLNNHYKQYPEHKQ